MPGAGIAWQPWLQQHFPDRLGAGFAQHHTELWEWAWTIRPKHPAAPFVACWARGGGKSTTIELIAVAWGALGVRRYVLYICETQEQADDHVQNIAALLESEVFGAAYPAMANRAVGKFGNSKGWRRNRLRTASGFVVDALGLDTAARGMNLEGVRPDAMIIDDIDGESDSEHVTEKKRRTLTRKILPAAGPGCVYMFVQNKVSDDSLMAQCIDGRADFLGGRIMSGPFPAIYDLETVGEGTEAKIVGGTAAWEGQSIPVCQEYIKNWGLDSFLAECQHESIAQYGRFLADISLWDACTCTLPTLDRHTPIVLAMDAGESSDCFALVAISRHPANQNNFAVRWSRVYTPTEGQALDFDLIEQDIRAFVAAHAVRELAYDRFLLGQMMRRFRGDKPLPVPLQVFSQQQDRLIADKGCRDTIITRTVGHDGTHADLRQHLDNANAKISADGRQLRIIKRGKRKIDAAVTLSMALARAPEVLPLIVQHPKPATVQSRWTEVA